MARKMVYLFSSLLGVRLSDHTSGYRIYRRMVLERILKTGSAGYAFQLETLLLALREGFRVREVL